MTIDYRVTRRALSLGNADSTTGWYAKNWTETTTEDVIIISRAEAWKLVGMGISIQYDAVGFTQDGFSEGDEIKDALNKYWTVRTVRDVVNGDSFEYRVLQLAQVPMHYDRPTTSGTWHLDSNSVKTDMRYLTKNWLATYIPTGVGVEQSTAFLKDDGATQAAYRICFAVADYPITLVFVTKGIDLIFSIGNGESTALLQPNRSAYAYHESVPIEIFAINKTGITATNLIEQGYQELRRIAEAYPTGSVRRIGKMTETTEGTDLPILYSQKIMLEYTRAKA